VPMTAYSPASTRRRWRQHLLLWLNLALELWLISYINSSNYF